MCKQKRLHQTICLGMVGGRTLLPNTHNLVQHIQRSQRKQKRNFDRHAKDRTVRVGDRVMVLMPREQTGKQRKLNRPYYGPYRVLDVHPNGVTVQLVDRPKSDSIRVNVDRVTLCYPELPDVSWSGKETCKQH